LVSNQRDRDEQKPLRKDASRDDDDKEQRPVTIRPAAKRVGEGDDNLKRREEWFRRRTTQNDDQG